MKQPHRLFCAGKESHLEIAELLVELGALADLTSDVRIVHLPGCVCINCNYMSAWSCSITIFSCLSVP